MFLNMIRVNNSPDKHIHLQLNQNEQPMKTAASKPQTILMWFAMELIND